VRTASTLWLRSRFRKPSKEAWPKYSTRAASGNSASGEVLIWRSPWDPRSRQVLARARPVAELTRYPAFGSALPSALRAITVAALRESTPSFSKTFCRCPAYPLTGPEHPAALASLQERDGFPIGAWVSSPLEQEFQVRSLAPQPLQAAARQQVKLSGFRELRQNVQASAPVGVVHQLNPPPTWSHEGGIPGSRLNPCWACYTCDYDLARLRLTLPSRRRRKPDPTRIEAERDAAGGSPAHRSATEVSP
jgi:hypothetical protein